MVEGRGKSSRQSVRLDKRMPNRCRSTLLASLRLASSILTSASLRTRLPSFTLQQSNTKITLVIDIGMIDLGLKLDFWSLERIFDWELEGEFKLSSSIGRIGRSIESGRPLVDVGIVCSDADVGEWFFVQIGELLLVREKRRSGSGRCQLKPLDGLILQMD